MTDQERRLRFEAALRWGGDSHSIADIALMVERGRAQWHQHGDGTIVTEYLDFPRFKAVNFWLISGNLQDCIALEPQVCAEAIEHGAEIAVATGRRGWARISAPLGWQPRNLELFWKPLTRDLPNVRG